MKSKQFLISAGILLISLVAIAAFGFSKLTPSASPSSTFHSLNDIYTLITNNTIKGTPNSPISTTNTPSATTSHSIGEIYTILANIKVNKATSTYSSLTPTTNPNTGTGYTLEDIWNLINNSTYASEGNHDITKATTPSATMHTTTDIYNYLNTTFRDNLSESKIRNLGYILGKTGTFVMADIGQYCEANDECNSGWCGDDSRAWSNTGNRECTTGTQGSLCTQDDQCISSRCAMDNGQGYPTCTDGLVDSHCENGGDCVLGFCDPNVLICTDGTAGKGCWGNESCLPELYCDTQNGECAYTDGEIGSGCGQNSDCNSGYCDQYNSYTCTDGAVGVGCSAGNQCASGYCNTDFNECSTGQIGAPCGVAGDCISNYCGYDFNQASSFCTDGSIGSGCSNNSACVSGYCDALNYQCSDGGIGSGCTNNNQCSSNLCSSVTNECISGEVGTSCTVVQECTSGWCDTFNGICKTDGAIGSACGLHSECDSYNCANNLCSIPDLTTKLSAYWDFNETSGTAFADASGNGKSGNLVNGTLVNQAGKLGTAFKFDGTNDSATVQNIDISNSSFTFSVWISNTGTGQRTIFGQVSSVGGSYLNIVRSDLSSGKASFGVLSNTALASNSIISTDGTWEHWVFVYTKDVGKYIYKNGVLDASATNQTRPYLGTETFLIGRSVWNNYFFKGTMDEIGLWNRALTADEVTQLYNGGAGLPYSSF